MVFPLLPPEEKNINICQQPETCCLLVVYWSMSNLGVLNSYKDHCQWRVANFSLHVCTAFTAFEAEARRNLHCVSPALTKGLTFNSFKNIATFHSPKLHTRTTRTYFNMEPTNQHPPPLEFWMRNNTFHTRARSRNWRIIVMPTVNQTDQ
jgi:hypothetical protein